MPVVTAAPINHVCSLSHTVTYFLSFISFHATSFLFLFHSLPDTALCQAFFSDIRSKTQGEEETQAQETQNSRIFRPKLEIPSNFSRRFLNKYNNSCLKSGKNDQKLKNLPKTQGKISKNLKFPANPLSSKARKTSKKSLL